MMEKINPIIITNNILSGLGMTGENLALVKIFQSDT